MDYTHYLDARYNVLAPDGTFIRAEQSKNYLDYIPFAERRGRPRPARASVAQARQGLELASSSSQLSIRRPPYAASVNWRRCGSRCFVRYRTRRSPSKRPSRLLSAGIINATN